VAALAGGITRADDPEQRDEDADDEHDPVPLAEAGHSEHEQENEVEDDAPRTDAPPHTELLPLTM
jgi:hypothetical protein